MKARLYAAVVVAVVVMAPVTAAVASPVHRPGFDLARCERAALRSIDHGAMPGPHVVCRGMIARIIEQAEAN